MQITTFAGVDIGSYEVGMKIFELSSKYGMREITYVNCVSFLRILCIS